MFIIYPASHIAMFCVDYSLVHLYQLFIKYILDFRACCTRAFPMTVFFTEKTSFCDFLQVYAHSEQFGLKFTWQMYLQHLTLRSKFEVFTA